MSCIKKIESFSKRIKKAIKDKVVSKSFNNGVKTFKKGFIDTVKQDDIIFVCGVVGIWQGLKYNGSIKNGVKGALLTALFLGTINGIRQLVGTPES